MKEDVKNIIKSHKEHETILKIIEESAENFGRLNLSSGNCGQFALALAFFLKEKGLDPKIGMLYEYFESEEGFSIEDLCGSEPKVYHIVLINNDRIYDGTGEITTQNLVDFSINNYYDDAPNFMKNIEIDNIGIKTIIDFDTDWSKTKEEFFDFLKNNSFKNNKKPKNKGM